MVDGPVHPRFGSLPHTELAGRVVPVASTPISRLLGLALLPLERAPAGLLIPRCRSVHTFGMRFPIDVVFLDGAGAELSRERAVRPRRLVCRRGAAAVLELPCRDLVGPASREGHRSRRRG